MNPKVYLETKIVSYLMARPSRDIVRAAEQQVTREWWSSREAFDLYVSEFVIDEAATGDPGAAAQRLEALSGIPLLAVSQDAESLGRELVREAALPANAAVDALHIALATVHGMDYLLTWNCSHIANAAMRVRLSASAGPPGSTLR